MVMLSLGACGGNKYNVTVVESGLMFKDYLKDGMISGVYDHSKGEWIIDETLPRSRTFIIKEQNEFEDIFCDVPSWIDFNKEMLLVYIFPSSYGRPCKFKSVKTDGEILEIYFTMGKSKSGYGDAGSPQRRIFAIKMKKLEIVAVEFNLV